MKIPVTDIARFIQKDLRQNVLALKKQKITPRIALIQVGESIAQTKDVKLKTKIAKELGVQLELIQFKVSPPFLKFANLLREKSHDPNTHGVIIQQPLPTALQSDTIYNFIPLDKELEGHRKKTRFLPPIGLTVLSILKYVYQNTKLSDKLYPDEKTDPSFFKQVLKQKKVVLIGRSQSAGQPIAQALSQFKINFINVNTQTYDPSQYYKNADVIVTAIGKKTLNAKDIKPGASLLNISSHTDEDVEAGDYDESEISSIAGHYTPTKGTCLLDSLFMFKNLIEAAKITE